MNILFIDWNCYGKEDILSIFSDLGHNIDTTPLELESHMGIDQNFVQKLTNILNGSKRVSPNIPIKDYQLVFTLNYYPAVSEACKETNTIYASWIYDSPFVKLYSANIINECNFIFIFDKTLYLDLKEKGIETVYYYPLAVNLNRLNSYKLTPKESLYYSTDVSFVGSLYNEKHNLYDRLKAKADEYTIGYLEGLMNCQLKIYGYNFLETALTDDIIEKVEKAMKYGIEPDSFATPAYVYANYFLCRKITSMERIEIIEKVSKEFKTYLYTFSEDAKVGKCINRGPVDFYYDMPKVFKASKINLNITLKSIQSGIPLRAMDIMGCGGFLLSNYQADFFDFFEPGRDFVYYESIDELNDKIRYYLSHEDERLQIAQNGYNIVKADHTYHKKLADMLDFIFN